MREIIGALFSGNLYWLCGYLIKYRTKVETLRYKDGPQEFHEFRIIGFNLPQKYQNLYYSDYSWKDKTTVWLKAKGAFKIRLQALNNSSKLLKLQEIEE